MTKNEISLTIHLLKMASDEFSNHGCNDYYLAKIIADPEERRALMKQYHEYNGDPEEWRAESNYDYAPDWLLMIFMAKKLQDL